MFGRTPRENDWYFAAEGQVEAVNRLLYLIENGEPFSMLEGPYGTGKTTVLGQVASEVTGSGRRVVRQNVASLDGRAVLWHLCGALSIFSQSDVDASTLMTSVRDELLARARCGHATVLLLDDIDLAQQDVGIVLNLLTSIAESSDRQISIVAAAERPLGFSLQKQAPLSICLDRLSEAEAVEFAVRRLAYLECPVDRVTSSGWRAIAALGTGQPSQLRRICEIVQVVITTQAESIDAALMHKAAQELLPHAA